MMWYVRRDLAGGPKPGTPAPRRPAGREHRRLALACLALATLGLEGCQSGLCGPCGIGSSLTNTARRVGDNIRDTTARVFHHKKGAACDTCGGGMVEGMPVEGSVISGGSVMPGPVIQAPAGESNPTILNPLPPGGSGSSSGAANGKSSSAVGPSTRALNNNRTASARSRSIESDYRGRGDNLARAALAPSPARVERSAAAGSLAGSSLPANLPPVDLSAEVAERASRSPVPPEAAEILKDADLPSIKAGIDTTLSPGLKRFSAVKPNVSGGSLPNLDGLDWLKEKGIKTILDLREPSEVDQQFLDSVKSRGFRYTSVPISAARLDPAAVDRFNDEATRPDGHPIYFFDTDGTRAGLIWYVHRLTFDKVDAQLASREAEELGLTEKSAWVAASNYLDANKPTLGRDKTPVGPAASNAPAALIVTDLSGPMIEWSRAAN